MNNTNLPIENKDGIFTKIKKFFRGIFGKKEKREEKIPVIEKKDKNDFANSLKVFTEEEQETMQLQKDYRAGKISYENLSDEQYEKLVELYNRQIFELKNTVDKKKKELEDYKHKIFKVKNNLA